MGTLPALKKHVSAEVAVTDVEHTLHQTRCHQPTRRRKTQGQDCRHQHDKEDTALAEIRVNQHKRSMKSENKKRIFSNVLITKPNNQCQSSVLKVGGRQEAVEPHHTNSVVIAPASLPYNASVTGPRACCCTQITSGRLEALPYSADGTLRNPPCHHFNYHYIHIRI